MFVCWDRVHRGNQSGPDFHSSCLNLPNSGITNVHHQGKVWFQIQIQMPSLVTEPASFDSTSLLSVVAEWRRVLSLYSSHCCLFPPKVLGTWTWYRSFRVAHFPPSIPSSIAFSEGWVLTLVQDKDYVLQKQVFIWSPPISVKSIFYECERL